MYLALARTRDGIQDLLDTWCFAGEDIYNINVLIWFLKVLAYLAGTPGAIQRVGSSSFGKCCECPGGQLALQYSVIVSCYKAYESRELEQEGDRRSTAYCKTRKCAMIGRHPWAFCDSFTNLVSLDVWQLCRMRKA